MHQDKKEKLA